jgi:hypothetical protein
MKETIPLDVLFESDIYTNLYSGNTTDKIIESAKALIKHPTNKIFHMKKLKYILENINRIAKEFKDKHMKGGSLSSDDLRSMLSGSYEKNLSDAGKFTVDKDLSGKRVKVYHNPETKQTVVSHRGTANMKDWLTDAGMTFGYEGGKRFKHSKKVQKKAEKKYGTENLTTVGHSLGARLAEKYGQKGNEVITLNKPIIPKTFGKKISEKQYDIRTENDPVSALHSLQKNEKMKTIKSDTYNPLTEHGVDVLKRSSEIYGKGLLKETHRKIKELEPIVKATGKHKRKLANLFKIKYGLMKRMKGGMAKETSEGRTNTEFYKGEDELINIPLDELPEKLENSDFTPEEKINLLLNETLDIISRNNDIIENENKEDVSDQELTDRKEELTKGLDAFDRYISNNVSNPEPYKDLFDEIKTKINNNERINPNFMANKMINDELFINENIAKEQEKINKYNEEKLNRLTEEQKYNEDIKKEKRTISANKGYITRIKNKIKEDIEELKNMEKSIKRQETENTISIITSDLEDLKEQYKNETNYNLKKKLEEDIIIISDRLKNIRDLHNRNISSIENKQKVIEESQEKISEYEKKISEKNENITEIEENINNEYNRLLKKYEDEIKDIPNKIKVMKSNIESQTEPRGKIKDKLQEYDNEGSPIFTENTKSASAIDRGLDWETLNENDQFLLKAIDGDNSQVENTKTATRYSDEFITYLNDIGEDNKKKLLEHMPIDFIKNKTLYELKSKERTDMRRDPENPEKFIKSGPVRYQDEYGATKFMGTKIMPVSLDEDNENRGRAIKFNFLYNIERNGKILSTIFQNILKQDNPTSKRKKDKIINVDNISATILRPKIILDNGEKKFNYLDLQPDYTVGNDNTFNILQNNRDGYNYYLLESTPKKIRYVDVKNIINDLPPNINKYYNIPQSKFRNIPKSYEKLFYKNEEKKIKDYIKKRTK